MIKRYRLDTKTTWKEETHQGDGSRVLGNQLYKHGVREGSQ